MDKLSGYPEEREESYDSRRNYIYFWHVFFSRALLALNLPFVSQYGWGEALKFVPYFTDC